MLRVRRIYTVISASSLEDLAARIPTPFDEEIRVVYVDKLTELRYGKEEVVYRALLERTVAENIVEDESHESQKSQN